MHSGADGCVSTTCQVTETLQVPASTKPFIIGAKGGSAYSPRAAEARILNWLTIHPSPPFQAAP